MHHRACRTRHAQHAKRQFQRMHGDGVGNAQRTVRLRTADMATLHVVCGKKFRGILEFALQQFRFGTQRGGASRPVRDFEMAGFGVIAIDAAVANQRAYGFQRAHGFAECAFGDIAAPFFDHVARAQSSQRHACKAAVAPAAAPTRTMRFEHNGFDAVLAREMVGARQAGVAAADDGDFGVDARGRGTVIGGHGAGSRGPVRVGIFQSDPGIKRKQWIVGHYA